MARKVIKLSEAQIQSLPEGTYSEGTVGGFILHVTEKGARSWRLRYRLDGKAGVYTIGKAGRGGLTRDAARQLAQEAKALVDSGIHPLKAKTAAIAAQELPGAQGLPKAPTTFEEAALDWLGHHGKKWRSESVKKYRRIFDRQVFPVFGGMPLAEVGRDDLKRMAHVLGADEAVTHTAWRLVHRVFVRCMSEGWRDSNPVYAKAETLDVTTKQKRAALERPEQVGEYLVRLDNYQAKGESEQAVVDALRLLALIPARVAELTSAKWEDIDLDKAQWKYVVSKKLRKGQARDKVQWLTVPLAPQALAILECRKAQAGASQWVFPSPTGKDQPIDSDRVRTFLVGKPGKPDKQGKVVWEKGKLGYGKGDVTAHGFRSTFKTLATQELEAADAVTELCLGHKTAGTHGDTYNRADMLPQRTKVMAAWAEYLDRLRAEVKAKSKGQAA